MSYLRSSINPYPTVRRIHTSQKKELLMDSVKQHGRFNDNHLGRLGGDECRFLAGHGMGSCGWLSFSLDD